MKSISFFDFDGTITKKDSLVEFIQFSLSKRIYYTGLFKLSLVLIAYTFKIIPNYVAKEIFLSHFFVGWNEKDFQNIADEYAVTQIDKIVRPIAIKKIQWHKKQGHKVVIVSASIESWLKKWCEKNNIDLIATRLEVQDKKITGKFATKNCYGMEKVNRIQKKYKLSEYECIYAYGDSRGDKEMLELANKPFYKPFR